MNRFIMVLVVVAMLSCASRMVRVSHAAIPISERQALIALYNSTDGDNWTDNSGWKEPPLAADGYALPGTEDTWYGITCSGDHVTRMERSTYLPPR